MSNVFATALAGARFRGLGALALAMDKTLYHVGEAPSYTVSGAAPNAALAWSSTRDGTSTGENAAGYGQNTDAQGVWSGSGNAWSSNDLGWWTKTATVNNENATRSFQVVPAVNSSASPVILPLSQVQQSDSWFSGNINLFGYSVPAWAVWGGAALLAYIFFLKKR